MTLIPFISAKFREFTGTMYLFTRMKVQGFSRQIYLWQQAPTFSDLVSYFRIDMTIQRCCCTEFISEGDKGYKNKPPFFFVYYMHLCNNGEESLEMIQRLKK